MTLHGHCVKKRLRFSSSRQISEEQYILGKLDDRSRSIIQINLLLLNFTFVKIARGVIFPVLL